MSCELFCYRFCIGFTILSQVQESLKTVFIRQAIRSILILGITMNFVSSSAFVWAQTSKDSIERTNDSDRPSSDLNRPSRRSTPPIRHSTPTEQPEQSDKRVKAIQNEILGNQEVKNMCSANINNIKFELTSRNKLLITTRNNSCSYAIMQKVLQPQLSAGKIRTYEFTGDREDVIVTLLDVVN